MPRRTSISSCISAVTLAAIAAALAFPASNCFAAANAPAQAPVDTKDYSGPYAELVGRFLAQPNKENFLALQSRVVADPSYDQAAHGLSDTIDLYRQKHYQQALDKFHASQTDELLSPQAHFYAARCYQELGRKEMREKELVFVRACLKGLMATGDGSAERPFVVTHVSDEYDLLASGLMTESKSQSLVDKKGKWYDVLQCANGKTYWFDVTLTFGSKLKALSAKMAAAKSARQPVKQPVPTRASLARAAYLRGVAAISRHEYVQAIGELQDASRLDSTNADAFFQRGVALRECGANQSAILDFTDAIRLRSDFAAAFCERGVTLRLEGSASQLDNALADFNEAIRLAPSDYRSLGNRATIWFEKGDFHKAIDDLNAAIRLRPRDAMSYNNRGYAYESLGDYERAVADFSDAIRLAPKLAESHAGRGIAHVGRGEFDPAIVDLSEAIRLKPDYAAAYGYRGTAYSQKGDAKRAQADTAKAAELRGAVASK